MLRLVCKGFTGKRGLKSGALSDSTYIAYQTLRIVKPPSVRNSSNSEMDGCVDPHCVLCTLEMKDGDAIVFGRQILYDLGNPSRLK